MVDACSLHFSPQFERGKSSISLDARSSPPVLRTFIRDFHTRTMPHFANTFRTFPSLSRRREPRERDTETRKTHTRTTARVIMYQSTTTLARASIFHVYRRRRLTEWVSEKEWERERNGRKKERRNPVAAGFSNLSLVVCARCAGSPTFPREGDCETEVAAAAARSLAPAAAAAAIPPAPAPVCIGGRATSFSSCHDAAYTRCYR